MDFGPMLFTSDRGITPAAAAKLADDHGFTTFYVPEHTHIPIKRQAAHPTGDELADDNVPPARRRTMLREYLEALRALWTAEEADYAGEFVNVGPSWAWPKPIQTHIPILAGAAGTEKNFKWIARSADGWITTPRDFDIDTPVKLLQDTWAAADRQGAPAIGALDFKPDPDKLHRWKDLGVTEVLFGLPDKPEPDIAAYVERLAAKLNALT